MLALFLSVPVDVIIKVYSLRWYIESEKLDATVTPKVLEAYQNRPGSLVCTYRCEAMPQGLEGLQNGQVSVSVVKIADRCPFWC